MADDAHSRFVDGQRVTALHLQHLQDRLREGIADIRSCIGLGMVAWGLRAELNDGLILVQPGAAFAQSGVRLYLDEVAQVALPADGAPWQLVLRALNEDFEELRYNGIPTVITLVSQLVIESSGGAADINTLVLATVDNSSGETELTQAPELFVATGHHNHSGEWRQNSLGQWLYDGPTVEGAGPEGPGERGPRGEQGPVGPQGALGAPGSQGPAGSPGLQGEQGIPGQRGDQGEAGVQGERGLLGPLGESGPAGLQGKQGSPGSTGEPGLPGAPGQRGAVGLRGEKGAAGVQGERGLLGPLGESGPAGLQGKQGSPGSTGEPGLPGAPGQRGAVGLKGEKGEAGAQGERGLLGSQGEPGPAGLQGKQGSPGSTGEPGLPGAPGQRGAVGLRGEKGAPGAKGDRGVVGPTGKQGLPGSQGTPGVAGKTGLAGSQGEQGLPGAKGNRGGLGPQGVSGATGNTGSAGKRGAPGPVGPQGSEGRPGIGLDLNWPAIADINWQHGGIMTPSNAAEILSSLEVTLSLSLSLDTLKEQPQVIQVLYEMGVDPQRQRALVPMAAVPGGVTLDKRVIIWRPQISIGQLAEELSITNGRIWIRIHCGAMIDKKNRPFSSSTDVLHGSKTPRVPGGVFESWYFVRN